MACSTALWGQNVAWLQPRFCPRVVTSQPLVKPRGLHIGSNDEVLLVERGLSGDPVSKILRLDDADTDEARVVPVAELSGLNHGIELSGGHLYASSASSVYRFPYETGQMSPSSAVDTVIVGMDKTANDQELGAPGGHTTRTLAFDSEGKWLYVSTGSLGNVDKDSFRSRIRRFDISAWDGVTPLEFTEGEVFADGLRNEVGLAFDSFGDLWGVENGADRLRRDDLGGDIHNENPAEELNRFKQSQAGQSWGYPYCWSEYCLSEDVGGSGMKGANTVWAWPSFMEDGYTDEWCRENTNQAVMSMPSHSAPLGITFYRAPLQEEYDREGCFGGFPTSMDGYAFIAFHGSWNRDIPTGYKVVYVPFDDRGNPTAQPIDLMRNEGPSAKWPVPMRPVDVQFDKCGRLFVTEDGTGHVIRIDYGGSRNDEFVPVSTEVADGSSCREWEVTTSDAIEMIEPSPTSDPTIRNVNFCGVDYADAARCMNPISCPDGSCPDDLICFTGVDCPSPDRNEYTPGMPSGQPTVRGPTPRPSEWFNVFPGLAGEREPTGSPVDISNRRFCGSSREDAENFCALRNRCPSGISGLYCPIDQVCFLISRPCDEVSTPVTKSPTNSNSVPPVELTAISPAISGVTQPPISYRPTWDFGDFTSPSSGCGVRGKDLAVLIFGGMIGLMTSLSYSII